MKNEVFRADVLSRYGAGSAETAELLAYNQNLFDHTTLSTPLSFPLPAEPYVATWQQYLQEAGEVGVYAALQRRLVQLRFPVQAGISQTEMYRAATRRGVLPEGQTAVLSLNQPETLKLWIHQSLAGEIPVLVVGNRADFVTLVQALTFKSEPQPVPDSMGACMVAGFNNWDRVRAYQSAWLADHPIHEWPMEFQRFLLQKELYQDRFIVLSEGPYSNVSATALGVDDETWRQLSLLIRLEHECTHYFTRRLLGSMRNNLLDELMADYMGLVAANGRYRADWFLHFMGLETHPHYRENGRLSNYRGQPPLSNDAFHILKALVRDAAYNLEQFDQIHRAKLSASDTLARFLITLTHFTLEELAAPEALALLEQKFNQYI